MKINLKNLVLFLGIGVCLTGCPDKPKLYEKIKEEEGVIIKTGEKYFLKGVEFDFITDEEHARRINGNNSVRIKYKMVYELIKEGRVDKHGNKTNMWIVKDIKLIDVWPKKDIRKYN